MAMQDSNPNIQEPQESEEEALGGCPITASIDWIKKIFAKFPGLGRS